MRDSCEFDSLIDRTQDESVHRVVQGAIPDVAYTNPSDGKEKIVDLKFINHNPSKTDECPPTIYKRNVRIRIVILGNARWTDYG
jgi:hypothetical protein